MSVAEHEHEGVVSPIELTDQIAEFGSPRMWVPLIGIALALLALFGWSAFAQVPVVVPADGVITTGGGPVNVSTSVSGTVTEVYVLFGEKVQPGNTIALITDDMGTVTRVVSPIEGSVIEVSAKVGDFATSGSTLVSLQSSLEGLEAIALVPMTDVGSVALGQTVLVEPSSVPASEYGYLLGTVKSIGEVPMSEARIDQLIGGVAGQTDAVDRTSPVVEVVVELVRNADNPSGFDWTVASGPPFTLLSSTPWTGDIVIGERSRLANLFGSGS